MAFSMRIFRKLRGKKLLLIIMFLFICISLFYVELTKFSQQNLRLKMNIEVQDKAKHGQHNHIENNRYNNNNNHDKNHDSSNHKDINGAEITNGINLGDQDQKIIIFPYWTPLNSLEIENYYTEYLDLKLPPNKNYKITKHDPEKVEKEKQQQQQKEQQKQQGDDSNSGSGSDSDSSSKQGFSNFRGELFKSGEDKSGCSSLSNYINFEVSSKQNFNCNLTEIIINFINSNSEYYLELKPFLDQVPNQIKLGTIKEHWFQMVGSSVYLKEYGVHLMISRIMYSPLGSKNEPVFSFAYAQIFDKNWQELKNVELIVPDNTNESMKMISYPGILSIPIMHDYREVSDSYYGPEDPRLILIKNNEGFEEPVIIFNAFHRKITSVDQTIDGYKNVKYKYYRSMFMSYPWKLQYGKRNIEETDDMESQIYLKTKELRIVDLPRTLKEKNWTPMISYGERQVHKFDKFIYFVYQWSDLQVLKCSLDEGLCEYTYKLKDTIRGEDEGEDVGALRGGTPMINFRDLNIPGLKKIPLDKEYWIGFPRAHLTDCRCSNHMYRPNLAIITKSGPNFKISHLSSFMSFNVELIGWYPEQEKLCDPEVQSVFIPNGISEWIFDHENDSDLMTLTFSLSDITIDMIQIRGLMTALLDEKLDIFGSGTGEGNDNNKDKVALDKVGFNNVNINCALHSSKNYCNLMDQLGKEETRESKQWVEG